jgi:glyoxylase-like metal-dependent hydrolase (beta-lactamase superfamily II)
VQLGRYSLDLISAGTFALDGGAMFGIIPKPLWEKKIPADDKNRIPLETRVMLLRDGARTVLVDCGMGTLWSDKEVGIYAIHTTLQDSLAKVGVKPADVTDLVLTHLHFDHAGGATQKSAAGELVMAFDNARVHIGRRNWEHAHAPNDRDRGSYRDLSWKPLDGTEKDRVVFIDDTDGRAHILEDLEALVCEGHTTGQLLPLVGRKDRRALYGADMIPTRAHVPPAWHMGYDLRPIVVVEEKKKLLELCAHEQVFIVHEHDPREPGTFVGDKTGHVEIVASPWPELTDTEMKDGVAS